MPPRGTPSILVRLEPSPPLTNLLPVTTVDWLIVAFVVLLAVYGYMQGFVVGALSLVGFLVGAFVGTRLSTLVVSGGDHSRYAPLFGLLGALLAGGVLATGLEAVGLRARSALRFPGVRTVDGVLGAALTGCVALGIAWIVGAIALQSSGSTTLRTDIQRSAILRQLNRILPPSGPILNALARFDPLPAIPGPSASVPPPTQGILAAHPVRAAQGSVVRILGTACGLGVEGSGWVAAPQIVVTNAHVVAGENDTVVEVGGNPPGLSARVLDLDVHDDVAVLRVGHLQARPLHLAAHTASGQAAAILGYPQDGPYNAQPGRIGQTQSVNTENAYGQGPITRSITPLRGLVRPGNSGGPLVDRAGDVLGTVFAAITSPTPGGGPGGMAVPNSVVRSQLAVAQSRRAPVSSGQCAG
jgi:Trypsin-like peptidase domain/Colicin V production protein